MIEFTKLNKVLIANRGEIACRLLAACKKNAIYTITIFTKDDCNSPHVVESDESHLISAYTDTEELIDIALRTGANGVIPGYGFVSENHSFAEKLLENGVLFIGPSPESIKKFGLKHIARDLAIDADVPVVPGSGLLETYQDALVEAEKIGYPVLLKASSGGGGMGMKICYTSQEIEDGVREVKSRGANLYKDDSTFLEKYVECGRHIEIQIFGNGKGDIVTLGERECSIQRRHQKVIEEAPSPFVMDSHPQLRNKLAECAKRLASSVSYKSAGTIEFLVNDETGDAYFLEMNTRLQVEHGITELCYDADLVTMMLLQADYELRGEVGIPEDVMEALVGAQRQAGFTVPNGHAIEVRIYAENPITNFSPAPGILQYVKFPDQVNGSQLKVRCDHWIKTGTEITPFYDPLLGKLMIWAPTRKQAISGMLQLVNETQLQGPPNNLEYLSSILNSEMFRSGATLTTTLDNFEFTPNMLEFVSGGALTTVQDFPGRLVYNGGIPRSGPVDDLSFRIGNALIGNEFGTEGLEIVMQGPSLYFHKPATIALCGAEFGFLINDEPASLWTSISIPGGTSVEIGSATGNKSDKCYLLIKGGLPNIAKYLGSKSTSASINIGGYQGRKFLSGDFIGLPPHQDITKVKLNYGLPRKYLPEYSNDWVVRCLNGPHSTDDILSEKGRNVIYNSDYKINSATTRGSVALDGPKCEFSRQDGGDGGNHPTNVTEYIYPYRGLSIIGDKTVVAGPDGITLSGFICPVVPVDYDWWKLGQAKTGSNLKFQNITYEDAMTLRAERVNYLNFISTLPDENHPYHYKDCFSFSDKPDDVILFSRPDYPGMPGLTIRQAGESCVILDHGLDKFSLSNCGRLYKFKLDIGNCNLKGINRIETANSLSVFFDPEILARDLLVETIIEIDKNITFEKKLEIPSRKFKIPVCLTHPLIKETVETYMKNQRPYAAYLPDNLDYIMKSSCIDTLEEFKQRAFNNPQIVVAVSFLCASNILVHADPRKSFLSGKYNPPRITGPAGSITTGSVVQGMRAVEGPGGYMLWGVGLRHAYWDTYATRGNFKEKGLPWFLEPFDQVEFFEATVEQVDEFNELNKIDKWKLVPEHITFDLMEYNKFHESVAEEVETIRSKQREAAASLLKYDNELKHKWELELEAQKKTTPAKSIIEVEGKPVKSSMAASVFRIKVKVGDIVRGGDAVVILEAMKTEIPVNVPGSKNKQFTVVQVLIEERSLVSPDDTILVLQ